MIRISIIRIRLHFYCQQKTIAFPLSEYDCISIVSRKRLHFHYQKTIAFLLSAEYDCISIIRIRLHFYHHDTHFYYQNTISDSLYSLFLLREFVCDTQKTSPVVITCEYYLSIRRIEFPISCIRVFTVKVRV